MQIDKMATLFSEAIIKKDGITSQSLRDIAVELGITLDVPDGIHNTNVNPNMWIAVSDDTPSVSLETNICYWKYSVLCCFFSENRLLIYPNIYRRAHNKECRLIFLNDIPIQSAGWGLNKLALPSRNGDYVNILLKSSEIGST